MQGDSWACSSYGSCYISCLGVRYAFSFVMKGNQLLLQHIPITEAWRRRNSHTAASPSLWVWAQPFRFQLDLDSPTSCPSAYLCCLPLGFSTRHSFTNAVKPDPSIVLHQIFIINLFLYVPPSSASLIEPQVAQKTIKKTRLKTKSPEPRTNLKSCLEAIWYHRLRSKVDQLSNLSFLFILGLVPSCLWSSGSPSVKFWW